MEYAIVAGIMLGCFVLAVALQAMSSNIGAE